MGREAKGTARKIFFGSRLPTCLALAWRARTTRVCFGHYLSITYIVTVTCNESVENGSTFQLFYDII